MIPHEVLVGGDDSQGESNGLVQPTAASRSLLRPIRFQAERVTTLFTLAEALKHFLHRVVPMHATAWPPTIYSVYSIPQADGVCALACLARSIPVAEDSPASRMHIWITAVVMDEHGWSKGICLFMIRRRAMRAVHSHLLGQ